MFEKLKQRLAGVAGAAGTALPGLLRDLAGLAAVGLIAYGAWLIYAPAGFIVAGLLLLAGVLLLSRKAG